MKRATREWVRKAEADYQVAAVLAQTRKSFPDQICFHCQQAVEKYLKALLEELALRVEKTHELDRLLTSLLPHYSELRSLRRGLLFLTNFAVEPRYPGENASLRQANSSLRWAARVRDDCGRILGIQRRKPRRQAP
jgi:HEPN domain-containing protein